MSATHNERIEINLPGDIIFAMRGFGKPEVIGQKMKTALALFLFRESTISLGKAAELAGMHRDRFIELLASHGIAAYEYSEQDFEWDREAVAAYRQAIDS